MAEPSVNIVRPTTTYGQVPTNEGDARVHPTYFLLPPHHRLWAVFADPQQGNRALEELRRGSCAADYWVFLGEEGADALDPSMSRHRLLVAIARGLQRFFSNDREYAKGLTRAVRRGSLVLAIKIDRQRLGEIAEVLRRYGGHELAYGAHGDFTPLPESPHTIGYFVEEDYRHEAGNSGGTAES